MILKIRLHFIYLGQNAVLLLLLLAVSKWTMCLRIARIKYILICKNLIITLIEVINLMLMGGNIHQIQTRVENFVKSKANGVILDLDSNFKLYYIKSLVEADFVTRDIQQVFFNSSIDFDKYFKTLSSPIGKNENMYSIETGLIKGDIFAVYGEQLFRIIGAQKIENRGVPDIEREASFEGGAEGFNEVTAINLNLVTHYYRSPSLTARNFTMGKKGHNNLVVLYDSAYVDQVILKEIMKRIKEIDVDMVQSLNGFQQLLWKHQFLIPRMLVTQRPDRVTDYISKGKIAIFLDGTPTSLILPVRFHDFIKTVDDEYLLPIPAVFLIILRYLALILSITMPALYVAVVSFNPEVVRVQLALSIATSRVGVPYPSFIEVIIMLLLMEFLIESSLRLPKTIGQTATTVGGLILGQAAIQAHLVSNIMIIIVSTVAISNFMIPIISMNLAVRVMKYIMLILVCFTGVYGLYLGMYCLIFYVASIHTFNIPYFNPVESIGERRIKFVQRRGQ